MSPAAEITDRKEYAQLLGDALPHVLHTGAGNERCTAVLDGILRKQKPTAEEKRLAELLTLLIEEFEEKHYALLRPSGPVDILRHLMESNGLRQVNMLDVFGTASVVSEVLKGKRELSKGPHSQTEQTVSLVASAIFLTRWRNLWSVVGSNCGRRRSSRTSESDAGIARL